MIFRHSMARGSMLHGSRWDRLQSPKHLSLNPDSVTKCVSWTMTALRHLNFSVLICKGGIIHLPPKAVW